MDLRGLVGNLKTKQNQSESLGPFARLKSLDFTCSYFV